MAGTFIGQQRADANSVFDEELHGRVQEANRGFYPLVGQDRGVKAMREWSSTGTCRARKPTAFAPSQKNHNATGFEEVRL